MPRPVILFSGPFSDVPIETLAAQAAEWGFAGFELSAWGDHLDIRRAADDTEYAADKLAFLSGLDLQVPVISAHRVGTAVGDAIDERHHGFLPDHVWGDGDPAGVRRRAAAEIVATIGVAQKMAANVVSGFIGSPIWSYVNGYPGPNAAVIDRAFQSFAASWHPILDACQDAGVRYAFEVHGGQLAYDLYTAERLLEAIGHRPEFGFCVDPAQLHWQGVDPGVFVRTFAERIYHVHLKDVSIRLDGRTSLLASYLPYGDPRRGWDFRAPGRGGIDWEGFMRALNAVGYEGALSVDWRDEGVDRDFGIAEACKFARQLDYPAPKLAERPAFR